MFVLAGNEPKRAGKESGELGEVHAKLIKFLHTSKHYVPERLLTAFPLEGMFFE